MERLLLCRRDRNPGLLTPRKMPYEAAKKRDEPYNRLGGELAEMRTEAVALVKQAINQKIRAYVLANNRSKGNAP